MYFRIQAQIRIFSIVSGHSGHKTISQKEGLKASSLKRKLNWLKRQPIAWKKNFGTCTSDRGLVSTTYKELKKLSVKKTNNLKSGTKQFPEEEKQMVKNYLKNDHHLQPSGKYKLKLL